ncbi:MAG: DUF480 domain-containing protein [Gemmatimonadetes bacterium]|nr:MAG: DUF480 domain-containing protein [Gemmatimonadota bacterium]
MQLSDVEVRILGCLMEKEATTPDNYPLSLNALTNACNQLSNREPVMSLGEDAVKWAVNSLRQQSLVRAIQPSDARVMKFQHLVTEKLDLDQSARAVLCVLMLRGPQTLGEIKTRTNRLAEFTSLGDVEAAVSGLIARELTVEMARRPGQKETRYAHLLSGPPSEAPAEVPIDIAAAEPPRDRVAELEASLDEVRRELAALRERFDDFTRQFS